MDVDVEDVEDVGLRGTRSGLLYSEKAALSISRMQGAVTQDTGHRTRHDP